MSENQNWLPLFPLNAVLFPDGVLPLKVFETRYIDMVRDCMRRQAPFGVVLIKSGQEVAGANAAAEPEAVGCLAHIESWDAEQLGVLLLRTQGGQRFRILESRSCKDLHLEARVALLPPAAPASIAAQYQACADTLAIVISDINRQCEEKSGADFASPFPERLQLDNAGWVADRWSEILQIPLQARQKLLELDDPHTRLQIIHQYLQQHRII
jgi:Lon protease-like protein